MKNILFITILGLATYGCGSKQEPATENTTDLIVEVQEATLQNASEKITFSGKVLSNHSVNISTKLMGRIEYLKVKEGEQINEGQTLIKISNDELLAKKATIKANLSEANAALVKVNKDYTRITNLYEKGSATEKEKDDITYAQEASKAKVEALKSSIAEINELLTYATIHAPFSGYITKKYVEEGDLANPGTPLITIESQGEFKVIAKIPENELSAINRDDEVQVHIQSLDESMTGTVTQINPSSISGNLQFEATIKLPEADVNNIKSGMYAEIETTGDTDKKLLLPENAIIKNGQLTGVYTINNQGKTALRWLRLGKTYNEKFEVLSGLKAGESYILPGDQKLQNGLVVQVKN